MSHRQNMIRTLAARILATPSVSLVRVAIDGDAGAGKTTLANELRMSLVSSGRPVICTSVDRFHHPREVRYRRGRASPDGFFLDSYDYESLSTLLLDPLSPGGSGRFKRAVFDCAANRPLAVPHETAEPNAILILEGLFLHRPELRHYWDFSLYLDVTPRTGLLRCAMRGDGSADPEAASNRRYVDGWRLYLDLCDPKKHASVVINNERVEEPEFVPPSPGRNDFPESDNL